MGNNKTARIFAILTGVFFFWGFVAASNGILIPVFKEHLKLSQGESQLIAFAFYVAYTIGSLIYFSMVRFFKFDVVRDWGYGKGIAIGLFISAIGTLLFIPAANNASFPLVLGGLMIVGIGFAFQQTAANPLAILLGPSKTGSQRLSMAGGINNLGTTIGPLLVSYAIFGSLGQEETVLDITAVKIPYLALGALFFLFGVIFWRMEDPLKDQAEEENDSEDSAISVSLTKKSALAFPQLIMGMFGIFVYVGVEVATADNLPEYLKQELGVATNQVAPFVSMYWASLMVGRWTSAASAFNISDKAKSLLRILLPFVAFGIFLGANSIAGVDVSPFLPYAALIGGLIVFDYLSMGNPARQLLIYSVIGILLLITGMYTEGKVAMFSLLGVGLFCSTLWPCIFTLSIKGLGKHTGQGSSFLVMMIMGGGIVSLTQGAFSELAQIGIRYSFWVGVICFTYLATFAYMAPKFFKQQGIED